MTYGHDKDGHVTSISYPGHSHAVRRGFSKAEQMASVTDFVGNKTTFSYDKGGRLATTHYPNGTSVTRSRDKAGQLSATALMKGSATLASLSYIRDANAQVTGQTPTGLPGATPTYRYTKRNRQLPRTPMTRPTTPPPWRARSRPTENDTNLFYGTPGGLQRPKFVHLAVGSHRIVFFVAGGQNEIKFEKTIEINSGDILIAGCRTTFSRNPFSKNPKPNRWYIGVVSNKPSGG